MTCATCRHRLISSDAEYWADWGICAMSISSKGRAVQRATLAVSAQWNGWMMVSPDFGCNQWAAKEEPLCVHCWHRTGMTWQAWPGKYHEVCCWCGETRASRAPEQEYEQGAKHGRFTAWPQVRREEHG